MLYTVLFALVAFTTAHHIPVKVIYDHQNANPRNLEPSAQQEIFGDEPQPVVIPNAIKNLNEKVQLSSEELNQAVKHLPEQPNNLLEPNKQQNEEEHIVVKKVPVEQEKKKEKIVVPEELAVATKSPPKEAEPSPDDNWHSYLILQQAQEIVTNGLDTLKQNLNNVMQNRDKEIEELRVKINAHIKDLKQAPVNNTNIISNLVSFVQNIGQNFQPANNGNGSQSDNNNETPSNPFIGFFQTAVQNIGNLANRNNNTQSDTESSTQGGFPIIQQITQVFNGTFSNPFGFFNQNSNGSQGDESNNTGAIQNFFQNFAGNNSFVNSITSQFQNFNFFQSTESPAKSTAKPAENLPVESPNDSNNDVQEVRPTAETKVEKEKEKEKEKEEIMAVVE